MGQRIEELKHDLAADGFCLPPFHAPESAFLAVFFTFNLLSRYQHQTTPEVPYRPPGTLWVAVFLCGAVLGVMGRALGLAQLRFAEIGSARRPAGHRRGDDRSVRGATR